MITIDFLTRPDYEQYERWLSQQSVETLSDCFGTRVDKKFIAELSEEIDTYPGRHYFLIAKTGSQWAGVLHMTTVVNATVEFKIIVDPVYRNQGIAGKLMAEAVEWAQNRRYKHLYMNCLSHNLVIQHLCKKHGLEVRCTDGVINAQVELAIS